MIDPKSLTRHYTRFRVTERVLLTGHSHQAWPDHGFEGQSRAWTDAAELVDDKWERAFAMAGAVRRGFARLLHDEADQIALGASTHDLLVRFLSGLPLKSKRRLVTTDGEFHSLRRQLDRLAEEGVAIVRVPAHPVASLAERVRKEITANTAAVLMSAVLFETAEIVPGLGSIAAACRGAGVEFLVDAYHAVNVIPFPVPTLGLTSSYILGGGYKYCQMGEGNCFLRFPSDTNMRPVVTGWYSEFEHLESKATGKVQYGGGPARFAGSTYDPTSHYRAAEVLRFFSDQQLTPERLRELNKRQISRLAHGFDELALDPKAITRVVHGLDGIAGFLALRTPSATDLAKALRTKGIYVDARHDILRLGPAPYVTDDQLDQALKALAETVRA
ncbi:MAG TPA: aminotransferase class V-fold PLP-dependent enzyme [Gemmatimonadales bacterium]|nr:aminotransferase class V-fold PLP-dependent enzyme [Gemmatimonadales bacterium]